MARAHHRALLVGVLVSLGTTLAACSSGAASGSGSTTLPTEPATTAPPASSSTTAPSTVPPTTSSPSTTSTAPAAVQDLTVTPTVRAALTTTFIAYKTIPASYVTGTAPNSVYYAFDPSSQKYWALAQFVPSPTASQQTLVGFQDGGDLGLYSMVPGGAWKMQTGGFPFSCVESEYFPASVMAAWGLPQPTATTQC
jgi:hypothetical protein